MRRLEQDERNEFRNLLALRSAERLFVQRWIELFDRDATLNVRCRPFWSGTIDVELAGHDQDDYHIDLMREELSRGGVLALEDIELDSIAGNPVEAAETLGRAVSALGFNHGFLFHGYKAMLYPPERPFGERLRSLCEWWAANSAPRTMQVFLRTTAAGVPPGTATNMTIVRWLDLQPRIAECAERCLSWWRQHRQDALQNCSFLEVTVPACDPNTSAALALERHDTYSAVIRGSRFTPIPIDRNWAFVDDPHQRPAGRTYALHLPGREFRARRPFSPGELSALSAACASDSAFRTFWLHFADALDDVFNGIPGEALDDISKALDIACGDYAPAERMGRPRIFVEVASKLLALDWCAAHYAYVMEYLLKPSFCIDDVPFGGERRPERVFDLVSGDTSWAAYVQHCEWDELLKYRRSCILAELRSLPQVAAERYRITRWDLARAVRARNSLFHRGQPPQDDYLLASLLDAFSLLAKLRLIASRRQLPVKALLQCAADDFEQLTSGKSSPDPRSLAVWGWRRWKSVRGDDLPRTPKDGLTT